MTVRHKITELSGIYFITFTCAKWVPLFEITNGYSAVYTWFDHLKSKGHHIIGYVIMPNHLHVVIAFKKTHQTINTIIGNGKRFIAYELVKQLKNLGRIDVLQQLSNWVNKTERLRNKKHQVFEPSFDKKVCYSMAFTKQKIDYIHLNPCKSEKLRVRLPEEYLHSSARYYYTGVQGVYSVITYMELMDHSLE